MYARARAHTSVNPPRPSSTIWQDGKQPSRRASREIRLDTELTRALVKGALDTSGNRPGITGNGTHASSITCFTNALAGKKLHWAAKLRTVYFLNRSSSTADNTGSRQKRVARELWRITTALAHRGGQAQLSPRLASACEISLKHHMSCEFVSSLTSASCAR